VIIVKIKKKKYRMEKNCNLVTFKVCQCIFYICLLYNNKRQSR